MQTTPHAGDAVPRASVELDYLQGVLEDEIALAHLLRWTNLDPPRDLVPNFWLWGTRGETGLAARLARTYLPRWRRCWSSAGELVARCGLSILQTPGAVVVMARTGTPVYATLGDFPNESAAILWAMCKASIGYLEAERAAMAAWRKAELARRMPGGVL